MGLGELPELDEMIRTADTNEKKEISLKRKAQIEERIKEKLVEMSQLQDETEKQKQEKKKKVNIEEIVADKWTQA